MFTGIIKSVGTVKSVSKTKKGISAHIILVKLKRKAGESISINGICSTVIESRGKVAKVFYMPETIRKTTVRFWRKGEKVNLETPLCFKDEIGGHLLTGHIDGIGTLSASVRDGGARLWKIDSSRAVISKLRIAGSVGVDGVSLTVSDVGEDWFSVSLTPFTLSHTNLKNLEAGSRVNIENDILLKYATKQKK